MMVASRPATTHRFLSDVAQHVRGLSVEQWGEKRAVEMIGQDKAFLELLTKVVKVAPHSGPVLIIGESGSGKEALAQALYLLGPRRGRPWVSVNCPQYQDGHLTVSELFGHRKGSFTGAVADRKGCFDTADGGVIFLDEIADLHMSAQVMLLRALASGECQPLGSDLSHSVNVRVIAATNRPLDKLMVAQEFRHDLFFRLRYFLLQVPSLRARGEDWLILLSYFLERLYEQYGVDKTFSSQSLDLLARYDWPGNVRQLISVAQMGYAMAEGDLIEPHHFQEQIESQGRTEDEADEDLFHHVAGGRADFWEAVYKPFLERDLNRNQVRAFVRRGLFEARNSYRDMLDLLHIPQSSYQKFMDFLRHHRLKP